MFDTISLAHSLGFDIPDQTLADLTWEDINVKVMKTKDDELRQFLSHCCDPNKGCPLLHMIHIGDEYSAVQLINRGAEIHLNIKDLKEKYGCTREYQVKYTWSILSWASSQGLVEVVSALLARGHDPFKKDPDGNDPFLLAGSLEIIEMYIDMFREKELFKNVNNDGATVLHLCLWDFKITNFILMNGYIDSRVKDNYGSTPLHVVCKCAVYEPGEQEAMIGLLLGFKAMDDRDILAKKCSDYLIQKIPGRAERTVRREVIDDNIVLGDPEDENSSRTINCPVS